MTRTVVADEIVKYLHDRQFTILEPRKEKYFLKTSVSGVAEDGLAESGELAWVSPKAVEADPQRVTRFRGSVLICPDDIELDRSNMPFLLPCKRPRLAFAEVVSALFADMLVTHWPTTKGAMVSPDAVLGERVTLSSGVVIGPAVHIGDDVSIGPNSCLANTTVNSRVRIGCNCSIGLSGFGFEQRGNGTYIRFPQLGRVLIDSDTEIGSNVCIDRGALGITHISQGVKIDNLVHVAHNVVIGRDTLVIANAMIGGSTTIGEGAWLAPSATLMNKISIGNRAVVGLGAVVTRSVDHDTTVVGNPARILEKKR